MVTPTWEDMFREFETLALPERDYPYSYQDMPLIKLFVYARLKGITGFQTLQKHLRVRPDVMALVGLTKIPHRKTIANRFRAVSASALSLLHQLTEKFIQARQLDPLVASVDSTLMHAQVKAESLSIFNAHLWQRLA